MRFGGPRAPQILTASAYRPKQALAPTMAIRFDNVSIVGLAHVDAPQRIPSASLELRIAPLLERFGLQSDILSALTGVHSRRFWDEGMRPSDGATLAAKAALTDAGLESSELGVLVNTSVSRDFIEPSTACIVHGNLGLVPSCLNFDLGNACLAFLDGMQVVGNMIERGQVDYGMVVDGESARFVVESTLRRLEAPEADLKAFRDNFATLTLGSGAAAVLLGRSDLHPGAPRVVGSVSRAATQHRRLCEGQTDGMATDASGLLVAGLEVAKATWTLAQQELGWTAAQLDELVLHQVSASHTSKLLDQLGLRAEKVLAIYPEHGNMGPASIPTVLSKARERGRLHRSQRVGLMGIGSGLNCMMMEVLW